MNKQRGRKGTGIGTAIWLCCVLFSGYQARAQDSTEADRPPLFKRIINKYFNDTASPAASSFTYYPTLAFAPETGVEIGASALQLFRAKQDTNNRLSEIQAFAFFTFNSQYGLWLDNAIYGDKDKWFVLGRVRFQRFPLYYYGIGPKTGSDNYAVVDAYNVMFRQRVLRKIRKNLFLGPEIDFQTLWGVDFRQPDQDPFPLPTGADGTTNVGLGAALVFDNRHNVLNVRKGFFGELSFLQYAPFLGSEYRFGSVNLEARYFHPVGRNNVLALQFYGNFLSGQVPFNQLALMGGEMLMRGYYQGRFRDKNLLAGQAEYRLLPFAFSRRLGAVAFAGMGTVAPAIRQLRISQLKYSAGVGLRYLLFPRKDIYIRLDVGFTQESSAFYIFNGEAF